MLGRNVEKRRQSGPLAQLWGPLSSVFRSHDLSLVNQEFVFTHSTKKNDPSKAFHFRAKPAASTLLKSAGIDAVSLANNHVLDYGYEGLKDTLSILKKRKIIYAGAGLSQTEAESVVMIKKKKCTIGFISITDNVPSWKAYGNRPGVFYMPIHYQSLGLIKNKINQAKNNGAKLLILSIHWGGNWQEVPPLAYQSFARRAIDLGIDIIHGHSGHIIQGIEIHKGKPIFYGLGDVIDDYEIKKNYRNDLGMVASLSYDTSLKSFTQIEMIPTKIQSARIKKPSSDDFEYIYQKLKKLSLAWGTHIDKKNHRFSVAL